MDLKNLIEAAEYFKGESDSNSVVIMATDKNRVNANIYAHNGNDVLNLLLNAFKSNPLLRLLVMRALDMCKELDKKEEKIL